MSSQIYIAILNLVSPLDGLDSPDTLVKRAKEIGLSALAITDHGTLAGHRDMYKAGVDNDFPTILGIENYYSGTNDRFDRRSKAKRQEGEDVYNHIILLAKNDNGLRNLQKISSRSWIESYYQKPICDLDLLKEHRDDIIVTSACVSGLVAKSIRNKDYEKAEKWALDFKEVFGDDFYIELQDHNDDIEPGLNEALLGLADKLHIKPIITTDTHFAKEEDRWIEDALLILNTMPKKAKEFDLTHAHKLEFMDMYNYLFPERTMSFQDIDVFLQNGETLYQKMVRRGITRTDIYSNTLEIVEKLGD